VGKILIEADAEAVEDAEKFGDFVPPKAGTYRGKFVEFNMGYSKFKENDDGPTGEEDKTRPRVEVILKITHEDREGKVPAKANYSRLYDYVRLTGDGHKQKRASLAFALGAEKDPDTGRVRLEIEDDPEKPGTSVGKEVIIRVKAGTNQAGEYRGEVGSLYPAGPGGQAPRESGGMFSEDPGPDPEEAVGDPFSGEDPDDALPTEEQLRSLSAKELVAVATEADVDAKAMWDKADVPGSKSKIVEAILAKRGGAPADDSEEDPF
jgi:hypothetical protein